MRLFLMRHGDAAATLEDAKRPLSNEGQHEVRMMNQLFKKNHIRVSQIYHSSKLRALETAEGMAQGMDPKPDIAFLEGLQPNDDPKTVSVICNHLQEDTLIVSHLPFLAKLVTELLLDREGKQFTDFQTAAVLCLERVAIFQWYITWFIQPQLLDNDHQTF